MTRVGSAKRVLGRDVTLLEFARFGFDGAIGTWSPGGYELPESRRYLAPRGSVRVGRIIELDADGKVTHDRGRRL